MFVMVWNRQGSTPRICYVNAERVESMSEMSLEKDSAGEPLWRITLSSGAGLMLDEEDMERVLLALGDYDNTQADEVAPSARAP